MNETRNVPAQAFVTVQTWREPVRANEALRRGTAFDWLYDGYDVACEFRKKQLANEMKEVHHER